MTRTRQGGDKDSHTVSLSPRAGPCRCHPEQRDAAVDCTQCHTRGGPVTGASRCHPSVPAVSPGVGTRPLVPLLRWPCPVVAGARGHLTAVAARRGGDSMEGTRGTRQEERESLVGAVHGVSGPGTATLGTPGDRGQPGDSRGWGAGGVCGARMGTGEGTRGRGEMERGQWGGDTLGTEGQPGMGIPMAFVALKWGQERGQREKGHPGRGQRGKVPGDGRGEGTGLGTEGSRVGWWPWGWPGDTGGWQGGGPGPG